MVVWCCLSGVDGSVDGGVVLFEWRWWWYRDGGSDGRILVIEWWNVGSISVVVE